MPYFPDNVNAFAVGVQTGQNLMNPVARGAENIVNKAVPTLQKQLELQRINKIGKKVEEIKKMTQLPKDGKGTGTGTDQVDEETLQKALTMAKQRQQEEWNKLREELPPEWQGFLPETYSDETANEILAKLALAHSYSALDFRALDKRGKELDVESKDIENQYKPDYYESRNKIASGEAGQADRYYKYRADAEWCRSHLNDPRCHAPYSSNRGSGTKRLVYKSIYDSFKEMGKNVDEAKMLKDIYGVSILRDAQISNLARLGNILYDKQVKNGRINFGETENPVADLKECVLRSQGSLQDALSCVTEKFKPYGYEAYFDKRSKLIKIRKAKPKKKYDSYFK